MKPLIILVLLAITTAVSVPAFCQEKKVITTNSQKFTKASIDSIADYERFKMGAEMDIISNNRKIAGFIITDTVLNNGVKKQHGSTIKDLQTKNNLLAFEIYDSINIQTDKWHAFKKTFQKNMYELMDAINNY